MNGNLRRIFMIGVFQIFFIDKSKINIKIGLGKIISQLMMMKIIVYIIKRVVNIILGIGKRVIGDIVIFMRMKSRILKELGVYLIYQYGCVMKILRMIIIMVGKVIRNIIERSIVNISIVNIGKVMNIGFIENKIYIIMIIIIVRFDFCMDIISCSLLFIFFLGGINIVMEVMVDGS